MTLPVTISFGPEFGPGMAFTYACQLLDVAIGQAQLQRRSRAGRVSAGGG